MWMLNIMNTYCWHLVHRHTGCRVASFLAHVRMVRKIVYACEMKRGSEFSNALIKENILR